MLLPTLSLGAEAGVPARAPAVGARIDFIDRAKAIGIVMVVAGHAPGAPPAFVTLAYSMHMPLFFLLSGYLLSERRAAEPWVHAAARGARTLLLPYLFFFALSLAYWLATRGLGDRAHKFAQLGLADALRGLASGLSPDLFVNVALWFLPCLFVCQLLYAAARQRLGAGALAAGSVLLALALLGLTLPWHERLPWGLDIGWIALPFYALGHWLRVRGRAPGAWLWLCAVPWLALVALQGRVDLAMANFGPWPLLYLPCALAGVGCVVALARLPLGGRPAWRWLADNSLVIFPLHPLLINFLSGAAQMLGLREGLEARPLAWWSLATLWGLLACVPIAALLRRHLPLALGLWPLRKESVA